MTQSFVAAQRISKQFAGVQALKDVSMAIGPGEIRCLVGENGCGKSTLIKILAGVYLPDCGTITINNQTMTTIGIPIPSPNILYERGSDASPRKRPRPSTR